MNNIYVFDLDDTLVIHQNGKVRYENMRPDKSLNDLLKKLGKDNKYIYTNGTYSHAETCLENTKLNKYFKKTFARDTIPRMKPYLRSFQYVQEKINNDSIKNIGKKVMFFDDNYDNIKVAKRFGWTTVWIHPLFLRRNFYMDYAFPNIYHALLYFSVIDKY